MSHLRHLMWVRIRAPILRTVNKLVCTNLWIQMLLYVTCSQWWSQIHLPVSLSNWHLKGKACVSWLNLAPKVVTSELKKPCIFTIVGLTSGVRNVQLPIFVPKKTRTTVERTPETSRRWGWGWRPEVDEETEAARLQAVEEVKVTSSKIIYQCSNYKKFSGGNLPQKLWVSKSWPKTWKMIEKSF